MINKVEVIVKEVTEIPMGYQTFDVPSEGDYLDKLMETINSIPGAKLVKYINIQDFIPDGTKVTVPLTPTQEVTPYEVDRGTLQFKTIIYYEVPSV